MWFKSYCLTERDKQSIYYDFVQPTSGLIFVVTQHPPPDSYRGATLTRGYSHLATSWHKIVFQQTINRVSI